MPRDLEIFFLYQQSGRFPDSQIITQDRLPKVFAAVYQTAPFSSVTVHSRMALYSLLTVTRSYRSSTCFPFTCYPPVLINFFTAAAAPDASSIVMGDILALQKLLCNRLYKKRGQIFRSIPFLFINLRFLTTSAASIQTY